MDISVLFKEIGACTGYFLEIAIQGCSQDSQQVNWLAFNGTKSVLSDKARSV